MLTKKNGDERDRAENQTDISEEHALSVKRYKAKCDLESKIKTVKRQRFVTVIQSQEKIAF
jgi:hypothetical protein